MLVNLLLLYKIQEWKASLCWHNQPLFCHSSSHSALSAQKYLIPLTRKDNHLNAWVYACKC